MKRCALALALWLCAGRALAHGPVPTATEIVSARDGAAQLVRLARGLAVRVPSGFRFVCPELWGGDVSAVAASLAAGPSLIAGETLSVLDLDGHVTSHAVQSGRGVALARGPDAVFGLFQREARQELRRLSATDNVLVRELDEIYDELAVQGDQLVLLGWVDHTLSLDTFSLAGEPRERLSWVAASSVSYARLHVDGGQLYVLVWGTASPWVTLGRVEHGSYLSLREAAVDIAGPVGSLLVADGVLQRLDDAGVVDTQGRRTTCLGEVDGLRYACAGGDLYRADERGLAEPLFQLGSLQDPEYPTTSEAARNSCNTRWLDLRVDVAAAQATRDAAVPSADAAPAAVTTSREQGCAVGAQRGDAWLVMLALALATATGRAQRGRPRSGVSDRARRATRASLAARLSAIRHRAER